MLNLLVVLASLVFHPTFNSCGISSDDAELKGCVVRYRLAQEKTWIVDNDFRGSLLNLEEDSEYLVRVKIPFGPELKSSFRTWKSDVPIARTIEIDPENFKGNMTLDMNGEESGWIRITSRTGDLFNPSSKPAFIIKGASHIIIDGIRFRGSENSRNVIVIQDSDNIRICNCDIAGWGTREFKQDFSPRIPGTSKPASANGAYVKASNGKYINYEAAIAIMSGSRNVVVERCFIHDPLCTSCSWFYRHPAGVEAVYMCKPDHSTVLRWNDFIGSDNHRWNDAVEGMANFAADGGFNRDADIYGNFMAFANDDCIELDGGQQNIRCFRNRFESSFCGISVQGCVVGPSFVFDNLLSGMGDQFGLVGQDIKTSTKSNGENAFCYIYDNILWGDGNGITGRKGLHSVITGNTFYGKDRRLRIGNAAEEYTVSDKNRMLQSIDESNLPTEYPERPIPFTLSRARITIGRDRTPVSVNVNGTLPEGTFIAKPDDSDWLLPIIKGSEIIVSFDESRMQSRRHYRGAFLVRTPNGLSRPVTIYADTDYVPELKPELAEGSCASYTENLSLEAGTSRSLDIRVPSDGRYWIFLHGSNEGQHQKVSVSIDGINLGTSIQQQFDYPTWSMLVPGCKPVSIMNRPFDLSAGKHTIKLEHISGKNTFDALVVTDSPSAFEPK